jgi:hypothetical protein
MQKKFIKTAVFFKDKRALTPLRIDYQKDMFQGLNFAVLWN